MKSITAGDLKKKIGSNDDFVLVDVLSTESFNEKHISKSISLPVDHVKEKAADVLPDKSKEIIVYCASTECHASPNAARMLEEMGYTNVVDFEAGLAGWEEAGFEFES